VSIADDSTGIASRIDAVTAVEVSACDGRTAEAAGTSRTSSKVRPSLMSMDSPETAGQACWASHSR
jgi:hypothetical protein